MFESYDINKQLRRHWVTQKKKNRLRQLLSELAVLAPPQRTAAPSPLAATRVSFGGKNARQVFPLGISFFARFLSERNTATAAPDPTLEPENQRRPLLEERAGLHTVLWIRPWNRRAGESPATLLPCPCYLPEANPSLPRWMHALRPPVLPFLG
jgi:hypothetical protein